MKLTGPHRRQRAGMVLLLALAVLAIAMVLLLALFAGASLQTLGAQSEAAIAREKMLADSAVALVIGQIQQASSQPGQAWISQPGLLRTYAATASRVPTASYKLYSTPTLAGMTDTSGGIAFLAADVPSDWSTKPEQYTDLNSPVVTSANSDKPIYPILSASAVTTRKV